MPDSQRSVLQERHDHVLLVTLNRPDALNAVDLGLAAALGDVLEDAEHDRDVRAIVLTGAGDKAFCVGADLKALARGEPVVPTGEPRGSWGFAGYVGHRISKPTIAAVNGLALGGGTELVLASDLAIADHAVFGLPEVTRGIFAAGGGAFRLPQQLAPKAAMELLLTGETIPASRALELGLINHVVPAADVLSGALELAAKICANAPLAVQATKRIATGILDERGWHLTAAEVTPVFASGDAAEGARSFAERRAPVWRAN